MAVTVKRIGLWRSEVANEPGILARTLEPLAASRASLRVVMGYRFPEHQERAAIEVYPVAGRRATAAAQAAGLAPSDLACLLVEGDDRPGLGARIGRALADGGVNVAFVIAQVVGRRFSAVIGFADAAAANAATRLVKAACQAPPAPRRKAARRRR
jgi:predicted amino acid-binding ACT domain protein